MKENFINSLMGNAPKINTGSFGSINSILTKKKPETQSTITANPAAVSPTLIGPAQFIGPKQTTQTSSPAKDAYVKSQMATVATKPTLSAPTETIGSLVNPEGAKFDRNTGLPLTTPSPTPAPEAPKAPTAYETAMTDYISSLKGSDAVSESQKKYNDFIASRDLGISNLEGQGRGIPLSLVRGQQSKLNEQAGIEGNRLLGEVGIAESKQKNLVEANKARVDYLASLETTPAQQLELKQAQATLDKTIADTKQLGIAKPVTGTVAEIGGRKVLINPQTGETIKDLGTAPMTQTQENAIVAKNEKEVQAQQQASATIGNVNNLLQGDVYKNITGAGQNPLNILGIANAQSINEYNQLQGMLKLGIRGLLKGQGAVSDYEGKVLGQAASALGRNLTNDEFKQQLLKIRGVLQTNNGGDTNVIVKDKNGKIIGQGSLNGQDIYEAINDGNVIEYQ